MRTVLPLHTRPTAAPQPWPRRVVLYSHDTQGLGHIRRNLLIAEALGRGGAAPDVLLISGSLEARSFGIPHNTDVLTLPALRKHADGSYGPRTLSTSLEHLVHVRASTITAAVQAFAPDLVIVDKVARGFGGELEPALAMLREEHGTHVVLGLREILDAPDAARREWDAQATDEAIAEYYDEVWVYGDPTVYDTVAACGLSPAVAAKVRYTGYLARTPNPDLDTPLPDGPFVLGLVGGGQDGFALADAFLRADPPAGRTAVLVTGPLMQAEQREHLEALAASLPGRQVLGFVRGCERLLAGAEAVVAMAGYNTTCELLAARVRTLLVPRTQPRREQLVRAERLADLGLVDMCHPDALSPAALSDWFAADRSLTPQVAVDLGGFARLPHLVRDLRAARHDHHEVCRAAV